MALKFPVAVPTGGWGTEPQEMRREGLWGPQHPGGRTVWTDYAGPQGVTALRATDTCPPTSVSPGLASFEQVPQEPSRESCWGQGSLCCAAPPTGPGPASPDILGGVPPL